MFLELGVGMCTEAIDLARLNCTKQTHSLWLSAATHHDHPLSLIMTIHCHCGHRLHQHSQGSEVLLGAAMQLLPLFFMVNSLGRNKLIP